MSSFFNDREDHDDSDGISLDASDISSLNDSEDIIPEDSIDNSGPSPKSFGFDDFDDESLANETFEDRFARAQLIEGRSSMVKPDMTLNLEEHDTSTPPSVTPLKRVPRVRNVTLIAAGVLVAIGLIGFTANRFSVEETEAKGTPPITSMQEEINTGTTADSSSGDEDSPGSSSVTVPRGGSLVKYSVKAEGDISSVAISYLNSEGNQEEEEGASVPWSKTVGMGKNKVGAVAAATSGEGTVTCSVYKDDKLIESNSESGDSPTLQCTGD